MKQLEREEIIWAMQSTYEAIGSDIGDHDLDIAVEMVLDANRIEAYGDLGDCLDLYKSLSFGARLELCNVALRAYF